MSDHDGLESVITIGWNTQRRAREGDGALPKRLIRHFVHTHGSRQMHSAGYYFLATD
ncbi:hypothetical protein [Bradyrhizobium ottawaense]|uniref:Uncharacterized protein n=1 Tax=Bradyrhizobium ottawaense TaxID=931866 RepID=A0ABV4FIH0_9BRAD